MSINDILVVSLDIHKKVHYAHSELKSSAKTIGKDFSFPNSAQGFNTFFSKTKDRLCNCQAQSIAVVLEPTGPYWKPFGYAVVNKDWPLYTVSTEQVYHQRIADDPSASKLDTLDPKTIAKLFRDGKATLARLPQGVFKELQKLHREYLDLTKKLAREKIQLKSILAEVNPEFTSFFRNMFGKIALAVISNAPTPSEIVSLGIENLTDIFKKHGNGIIGRKKLGDPLTIHSPKAMVKLAGLIPKEFQSGSSVRKKAVISRKGNPYLRTIAYYMAISCVKRNHRLSAYYKHLISKGKPKMVALCAVARKILIIIYHVIHNEPYISEKVGIGLNKRK